MSLFRRRSESEDGPTGGPKPVSFDSADEAVLDEQIQNWINNYRPRLGEILMDIGVAEPAAVEESLLAQARSVEEAAAAQAPGQEGAGDAPGESPGALVPAPRLGEVMIEKGHLDEISLAAALSRQFGVPMADLRVDSPTQDALDAIPESIARQYGVLPLRFDDTGRLEVVSSDPYDTDAIRAITHHIGKIALRIGAPNEIERQIDSAYNVLSTADEHIRAFELSYDQPEQVEPTGTIEVDDNAPIVQMTTRIITQAVRQRASDVHVEPGKDAIRVRYRIDGAMTGAIELPVNMGPGISSRVKVLAELNIVERRRPQDGQFGMQVDGRPIDIRCSVVPTMHGEKIVLRLLDKTRSLMGLNDLGMSEEVAESYREIVNHPLGLMLCTGPTGSGKTTTLYATLNEVNDATKNVVTIEDPVEYEFEGITQIPVIGDTMGFADGLRGVLRQDPDTILVGEIRDQETARIAMQAALTGHFVLSSLHSVDAVAAIHRFTDMGIEPFLVASAISGVVGQRLLRRVCTSCAEPYQPTAAEARTLRRFSKLEPTWKRGRGCQLCSQTGYRGRVGVYELLVFTDEIRDMVVARASHHEIHKAAVADGMRSMREQAFDMVAQGITTVDDVLRSVYAPGMDEEVTPIGELLPVPAALEAGPLYDPDAPGSHNGESTPGANGDGGSIDIDGEWVDVSAAEGDR